MRAYQNMVFSTAARLTGNDAQAQELAQETFLKAWEHFDSLRESPTAGGWLKTVVTRLAINHIVRHRNRFRFFADMRSPEAAEDEPDFDVPVPDNALADLEADERHARVEQALQRLPDHQRVPLVLFHFEDMSYEQIAKQLRISLPKLKTDIMRGRAALARTLEPAA
jgi:RNA polymerase sigma-70 factor (ECF subfamily)